jgi:predicted Co/Zn/Cd cation transporter (cation efflux family)
MKQPASPGQKKGLTAIDGAMALIVILLVVQIWLLIATLETYLAGHRETALAGAIISGMIFFVCFSIYLFIERMDNEVRQR